MNSSDDSGIDDTVRTAWRAAADERTPPSLDSKVLRQAAVAAKGRWRLRPGWMQPVAFAATLVIGVVIFFYPQAPWQFSGEPSAAPPRAHDDASGRDGDAVRRRFEASADDAARSLRGVAASDPASLAAGREAASASRGTVATPGNGAGAGAACSDAERSSAATWWLCTQALLESGDEQAASRELELLREFHPGFEPPE